jgi:hypothetical protein
MKKKSDFSVISEFTTLRLFEEQRRVGAYMNRSIVFLCAMLIIPFSTIVISVNAEGLSEAGRADTLDGRGLFWELSDEGNTLYINDDGSMIYFSVDNGVHSELWNLTLSISVKCVRMDDTSQWLALGHSTGALLISMTTQSISENISTENSVSSIDFDVDGDLWLGFAGEPRRALEYRGNITTAVETDQHFGGVRDLTVLSDGKIVTAGNDKKIYIFDPDNSTTISLTEPDVIETMSITENHAQIYLTTSAGDVVRYNTSDLERTALSISSASTRITFGAFSGDDSEFYAAASSLQKVWVVNTANLSITEEISATGMTIGAIRGDRGELYIISSLMPDSVVRLFDLDSDSDGTVDSLDEFPEDSTQQTDADGDNHGDNPTGNDGDAFPENPTQWDDRDGDGWGDNANGTDYDAFPDNDEQHADSDGDGWGDDPNGEHGDEYPDDATQWVDSDSDGKGDNPNGTNGDGCPAVNGFSEHDRNGCKDSDGDGWSNPDTNWTYDFHQCTSEQINCADAFPNEGSQWSDQDGDGYGDNVDGLMADSCHGLNGNSTKVVNRIVNADDSITWNSISAYGCTDTDGDGYADYGDHFPANSDEHLDRDTDGIGSSVDYNDTNSAIQTLEQHCLINTDDTQSDCKAVRDQDYQTYLAEEADSGDALSYPYWLADQSKDVDETESKSSVDEAIENALTFGGLGFIGLTAAILLVSGVITILKKRRALKAMGGIKNFNPRDAMEELSAEESGEAFTASGGVVDQEMWEDEIPDIELGAQTDDDVDDADSEGKVLPELDDDSTALDEDVSLEEMAGDISDTSAVAAMEIPEEGEEDAAEADDAPAAQPAPQEAPEAPPLPASGLPAGWTEEQWRWYGHQWLKDNE